MKTVLLLALLPLAATAQPGDDLFRDPCGMGGYGVALQDISRFDMQVNTLSVGTDDVPSSSGNCVRNVTCRAHAQFLVERDDQNNWNIVLPKPGDVLHPDSLKAGIAAGKLRWGPGQLTVCYQGYGAQNDGKGWKLVEPRTWERSVVRVETPDAVYLVAMTIVCHLQDGTLDVRGARAVEEGAALPIP